MYKTCPDCNGQKGWLFTHHFSGCTSSNRAFSCVCPREWADCRRCQGTGQIQKPDGIRKWIEAANEEFSDAESFLLFVHNGQHVRSLFPISDPEQRVELLAHAKRVILALENDGDLDA